MTLDREIIERLDACRPGDRDLFAEEFPGLRELVDTDPEVARRYTLTQRFDAELRTALADVEPPTGAAERVLQQLAAARVQTASGDPADSKVAASEAKVERANSSTGGNRRPLWRQPALWMAAASVAAAILLAVFLPWQAAEPLQRSDLVAQAQRWEAKLDPHGWNFDLKNLPAERPPRRSLPLPLNRWQQVETTLDQQTAAYDLSPARGPRVTLFVAKVSEEIEDMHPVPPSRPDFDSGGITIGSWQSGDRVYVIVVHGDAEQYRRIVDGATAGWA